MMHLARIQVIISVVVTLAKHLSLHLLHHIQRIHHRVRMTKAWKMSNVLRARVAIDEAALRLGWLGGRGIWHLSCSLIALRIGALRLLVEVEVVEPIERRRQTC